MLQPDGRCYGYIKTPHNASKVVKSISGQFHFNRTRAISVVKLFLDVSVVFQLHFSSACYSWINALPLPKDGISSFAGPVSSNSVSSAQTADTRTTKPQTRRRRDVADSNTHACFATDGWPAMLSVLHPPVKWRSACPAATGRSGSSSTGHLLTASQSASVNTADRWCPLITSDWQKWRGLF